MKKIIYSFILILLTHFPAFPQENKLDEIIKEANVSGIQLIYSSSNKTQAYNLGVEKDGSQKRINSNTIFGAASLSKTVFAYAVLRLYDRGIIDIDTPLLNYMGSYERFDHANPNFAKITARMVLRHTTGLPN